MLRFCDGFDFYSVPGDPLLRWNVVDSSNNYTFPIGAPGSPGQCLQFVGNSNEKLRKTLDAQATWIVGIRFKTATLVASAVVVRFLDSSNNEQCSIRTDASAHLILSRNGTAVGSAGSTALLQNTWYHLEAKVTINNSTGAFEIKLNGSTEVGPTTGANTRAQTEQSATSITFLWSNTNSWAVDDAFILDTSGSVANDFIGQAIVYTSRPRGAGNYAQWSGSYADNVANVNEQLYDGDTTFNQSNHATDRDSFQFDKIPAGTIAGVQTTTIARQNGGSTHSIKPFKRIGGTNYDGTAFNTGASYVMNCQQDSVSPATSSAWTQSEINGMESGYLLSA